MSKGSGEENKVVMGNLYKTESGKRKSERVIEKQKGQGYYSPEAGGMSEKKTFWCRSCS